MLLNDARVLSNKKRTMENQWISVTEKRPPQKIVVDTKIDKDGMVRNEQALKLVNNLWFFPDGSAYVYFEPTHWRYREIEKNRLQ